MNLLDDTFPTSYHTPKTEIVCKSYDQAQCSHVIIMIMLGTCILTMSIQVKDVDKFNHIIANYVFSFDGV
jgi:hypothetical protein